MRACEPIDAGGWGRPIRLPGTAAGAARAGELASAAILFADIVGFTKLCERMGAEDAFAVLAGFHGRMADVMAAHGVGIADYIGDGVMAVWTATGPVEEALRAFRCGFAMLEAVERWNGERIRAGGRPIRIGVGLNAGAVMVGRTGGPGHAKLGAFGDAVNVAHRLERMTRAAAADVAVSDALFRTVAAAAPDDARLAAFCGPEDIRVPGRSRPVRVRTARLG
jgi:adenylate cyclase